MIRAQLVAKELRPIPGRFGWSSLILAVVVAAWAPGVGAQGFRCNGNLIREGMKTSEIREKCRAPDLVRRKEEPVYSRLQSGATVQTGVEVTEYWFYDRGPNEYVIRITVRDAVAEEVELMTVTDLESLTAEPTGP
jgi:hypothetical protein